MTTSAYLTQSGCNLAATSPEICAMSTIIKEYIPEKKVALDIGCHYAFFTKFLSEQFETVHAFDFNNDIYKCFETNMEKFKCENVIRYPHGLGEKQRYVATNDWSQKHRRRGPLANHIDPNSENKTQKIKSLDSLKIKDIGLIMIDTEGYELNVMKGAINTIKKYKPVLVLEFHRTKKNNVNNLTQKFGYSLSELQNYVENLGYQSVGYLNKVDQIFVSK